MKKLLLITSILYFFIISCSEELREPRFHILVQENDNKTTLRFIISGGEVEDFNWVVTSDLGDETIVTGNDSKVTMFCNGNYTIQMISVRTGEIIETKEQVINIVPNATHNPSSFLFSPRYSFLALGGNTCFSYEWDIDGDGIVDYTDRNFIHRYDTPGIYNTSLRVVTNDGKEAVETNTVLVRNDSPIVEYNGELSCVDYGEIFECFEINDTPLQVTSYFDSFPLVNSTVNCLIDEIREGTWPYNLFQLDYTVIGDTLVFDHLIESFVDRDCSVTLKGYVVLNADQTSFSGPVSISGEYDGTSTGSTSCTWTMDKVD